MQSGAVAYTTLPYHPGVEGSLFYPISSGVVLFLTWPAPPYTDFFHMATYLLYKFLLDSVLSE